MPAFRDRARRCRKTCSGPTACAFLPEIVDSLAGGPTATRLDTIDTALKGTIKALLDTGAF